MVRRRRRAVVLIKTCCEMLCWVHDHTLRASPVDGLCTRNEFAAEHWQTRKIAGQWGNLSHVVHRATVPCTRWSTSRVVHSPISAQLCRTAAAVPHSTRHPRGCACSPLRRPGHRHVVPAASHGVRRWPRYARNHSGRGTLLASGERREHTRNRTSSACGCQGGEAGAKGGLPQRKA